MGFHRTGLLAHEQIIANEPIGDAAETHNRPIEVSTRPLRRDAFLDHAVHRKAPKHMRREYKSRFRRDRGKLRGPACGPTCTFGVGTKSTRP